MSLRCPSAFKCAHSWHTVCLWGNNKEAKQSYASHFQPHFNTCSLREQPRISHSYWIKFILYSALCLKQAPPPLIQFWASGGRGFWASYLRWPYKDVPFLWCHTNPTVEKTPAGNMFGAVCSLSVRLWYERSLSTGLTLKCLGHSLMTCLGHSGSFNQPQSQLLNETQSQVTSFLFHAGSKDVWTKRDI